MKKLLSVLLLGTLIFALVACGRDPEPDPDPDPDPDPITCDENQRLVDGECVDIDITPPVLSGVVDVEIFVDEDFDPMEGVTAIDDVDGDITDDIVITGLSALDTSKPGTYFLRYAVEDAEGNRTERTRYITVKIDPDLIGDGMVPNGDFSLGWAIWTTTTGLEGGNATYEVVDGELKVVVTSVSGGMWEPRLENQGITFEEGKIYQVTFDARAEAPRAIHVQVGELLPSAPWFTNFKPGIPGIFDLTTEMTTYSFTFQMGLPTNENGSLIFEMGTVPGTVGTDNLLTTVYLDNVEIIEVDEYIDDIPPVISGVADTTITQGTEFDPLEGVSIFDNVDGDIDITELTVEGEVDILLPGEYTLTYTVSDEAGNEAVVTRVVTVIAVSFIDSEQIVDGSFETTTEVPAEVQDPDADWADITDPGFWYHYIADWDGAAASFVVTNGAMVIDVEAAGNNDWGVMLKQKGLSLVEGTIYKLVFTASSSVDRDIEAKVTDNFGATFNLTETPQTFEFIFIFDDEDVDNERVIFLLGNTANFAPGVVTIDDVRLYVEGEEGPTLVFRDTHQVVDGNFETTTEVPAEVQDPDAGFADITDPGFWYHYIADWDGAAATFTVTNGAMVIDVEAPGNHEWGVMLKQKGFELVEGMTYRIGFTASSTVERDIEARMTDNFGESFMLTETPQRFEFTFLYDGEDLDNATMIFILGATDEFTPSAITIDNVVFYEGVDPDDLFFVDTEQIVDGSFDTTTEVPAEVQDPDAGWADITDPGFWYHYIADWDGAAATFTVTNGAMVIDVEASGNHEWGVMLKQKGLSLVEGTIYKLVFTASSTVDRDIEAKVTDYYGALFNLTEEPQTFEFAFYYEGEDSDNELVLFLLGNTPNFAPGVVTIDDVRLYVEGEEFNLIFRDTKQVVDGSFETTTEVPAEVQDPDAGWADITDPGFWYHYLADWDGAAATFAVTNGAMVIDVEAPGNHEWGVMLKQKGFNLVEGMTYRISFTASSTVERDIEARMTDFFGQSFMLTETPQDFEFTFVYDGESLDNATMIFILGATPEFAASVVTIDNVAFYEGIDPEDLIFRDTEQVVDGSFETTTEVPAEVQDPDAGWADITDPGFWYHYIADWDGAAATFTVTNGAMEVDVEAPGNHEWGVMLKQKGFDLVEGTIYRLSFTASSTVERDIEARMTDFFGESFMLTETPQDFEFIFLYDGETTTGATMIFILGATPEFEPSVVTIDNVVFSEGIHPKDIDFVDTEEVVDGSFETTTEVPAEVQDPDAGWADITDPGFWYYYIADWDGAAATFAVTNGAMVIDVEAPGNHEWGVMLKQKGFELVEGTIYQLVFTASSTVERDIEARMTDFFGQSFTLTETPQEFVFTFLYDGESVENATMIFILGATPEFEASVITIEEVAFYAEVISEEE